VSSLQGCHIVCEGRFHQFEHSGSNPHLSAFAQTAQPNRASLHTNKDLREGRALNGIGADRGLRGTHRRYDSDQVLDKVAKDGRVQGGRTEDAELQGQVSEEQPANLGLQHPALLNTCL